MSNEALKYRSTPQFRKSVNPAKLRTTKTDGTDTEGLEIGNVLDLFTKKQGVACDGAINGIAFPFGTGAPTSKITFEAINGVDSLVVRDCTGAIVFQTGSAIDPQALSLFYRATLTGSNGAIAAPSVAKNTLSAAIVWAYVSEGVYTGTLTAAFPSAARTSLLVSLGSATGGVILKLVRTSADVITLSTFAVDGTTPADFIGDIDVSITIDPA